jgi:hypothetical protein
LEFCLGFQVVGVVGSLPGGLSPGALSKDDEGIAENFLRKTKKT